MITLDEKLDYINGLKLDLGKLILNNETLSIIYDKSFVVVTANDLKLIWFGLEKDNNGIMLINLLYKLLKNDNSGEIR